jgi:hypothetical protein
MPTESTMSARHKRELGKVRERHGADDADELCCDSVHGTRSGTLNHTSSDESLVKAHLYWVSHPT